MLSSGILQNNPLVIPLMLLYTNEPFSLPTEHKRKAKNLRQVKTNIEISIRLILHLCRTRFHRFQRGQVVSAPDLKSRGPELKSRSDH